MKSVRILLLILFLATFLTGKADEHPWKKYGFNLKVVTLSNGKYQEFHDLKDVVEIGSVLYNTQTQKIVGLVKKDTTNYKMPADISSRWFCPDPLTEEYSSWSPYNYVMNNPIKFIDPDGRFVSPIYNKEGDFLGTDDQGLQGEAIIMDEEKFTQGMSHKDALENGTLFSELGNLDRWNFMEKGYTHWKSLDQRPDWDGVVTIKEGIAWAKSHPNLRATPNDNNYLKATPNDALYLDVSKMDFGRLSISDFKNIGVEQGVNLLNLFNGNPRSRFTTYALGRTRMTLLSTALGGIVKVSNGTWNAYDWDYGGNLLRETLIFGERTIKSLNDTHGFPIKVYGTGFLNK